MPAHKLARFCYCSKWRQARAYSRRVSEYTCCLRSPAKVHQLSMTERLFGAQRRPKGITLAEWPEKPCAEAMAAAQPPSELGEAPLQLSCVPETSHCLGNSKPINAKAMMIVTSAQIGCLTSAQWKQYT